MINPSMTIDLRTLRLEKVYNELCRELNKIKIGILFNCAGIAEYKTFRFVDNTHEGKNCVTFVRSLIF